jgi:hypothetical protein
MVFELDLGAIRSAAAKRESNHWLMANPANVANLANENQPNSPKSPEALAKLAGLATLAISHGLEAPPKQPESVAAVASRQRLETAANDPAQNLQKPEAEHQPPTLAPGTVPEAGAQTRPPPPAYDPGHAALLALAMAYCDRTGASDQARQDWQRDIADTPPELRADLYQHLRAQLPPAPPRPAPAAAPRPPAPMSWSDLAQPWRAADSAYLAHWGQCIACKAAATGHADRCATGQHLHDTYLAALAST